VDPKRLDIRGNLTCGSNVKIDINVILEDSVIVGANCILKNCKIGKNTILHPYSLVDDAAANTLTIARSRQVKIENWKGPKLRK